MRSPPSGSPPRAPEPTTDDGRDRGWWLAATVAVWAAWFPVETNPLSGPLVAACLAVLVVWRWDRAAAERGRRVVWLALPVLVVLAASGVGGLDPARAVPQLALTVAIVAAVWAARDARPPRWAPVAVAAAIAGLAVWAGWQQVVGLGGIDDHAGVLGSAERAYVETRIAAGRPSASQLLPGHLAALLATALPLLVGARAWRWPLVAVVVAGLVLTRSPVGIALAVVAVLLAAAGLRSRRLTLAAVVMTTVAGAVVVATRPDVARLEPVALRLDNWRTAAAVWRDAPAAGVGFGGFGQAAQSVDLDLGNRPAHAHSVVAEGLAELGPVGLLAAVAVLVAVATVAWRLRDRDPWLAAAVVVVPAHNLVDFSWWVSGVALPWAVLFGWAVSRAGPAIAPTPSARYDPLRVTVTAAAAVAVALALLHATSRWTEWTVASDAPALERAATLDRAWRLAPWRPEPALLAGVAAIESGDGAALDSAARVLARVTLLRPFSADVAAVRARVEEARGDDAAAAAAAWTVQRRRRAEPGPSASEGPLSQREAPGGTGG